MVCVLLLMGWSFARAQEAETPAPILSISTIPRLDPPPVLRDYLFLMGDLSEQLCTDLEGYYGLSHPNFHAYLCFIGLRYADGTPKQAWQTFVDQGQAWRARH